jgi:hypothetical protein
MTAQKFVSAHDPRVQELKSSLELESRQVLFSSMWFVGGETSAAKMGQRRLDSTDEVVCNRKSNN